MLLRLCRLGVVNPTATTDDLLVGLIQCTKLVLQKLLSVCVVLRALGKQLAEGKVLIQRSLCLFLELEDVAEAGVESDFSAPVKTDLGAADIRMSQILTVHIVDCTKNLLGQCFQHGLR